MSTPEDSPENTNISKERPGSSSDSAQASNAPQVKTKGIHISNSVY